MKTGRNLKIVMVLLALSVFTGCPWSEYPQYRSSPILDYLVWKPDGSGFVTVVNDYGGDSRTTLAIYDSVGTLLKTVPLNYYLGGSEAGFVHQGADLLVTNSYGTSAISLTDGTVRLYSDWYLRSIDSSGQLVLLSNTEYYPASSQPYTTLAIGAITNGDTIHIFRSWKAAVVASPTMLWTANDRFSLMMFDSSNGVNLVEFDTTLKQHSIVTAFDSNSYYSIYNSPSIVYSRISRRYYFAAYPNLFSIDLIGGTRSEMDPGSNPNRVCATSDGSYLAYTASNGNSNVTKILNTVTGATGILPYSDSKYALSPNGLHFAYSQTQTAGPLVHVVNVTLP